MKDIRTNKADKDDFQVVGQTANEDTVPEIMDAVNDNDTYVRKKDGSIFGNNSIIEAFTKTELIGNEDND